MKMANPNLSKWLKEHAKYAQLENCEIEWDVELLVSKIITTPPPPPPKKQSIILSPHMVYVNHTKCKPRGLTWMDEAYACMQQFSFCL